MEAAILIENLISPLTLAFLLGAVAAMTRSELEIPEPVMRIFGIFLLFSIGLQGGRQLAEADPGDILSAIWVTALLVFSIPAIAFLAARHVAGLDISNAAGIATLYGSVSSVTFLVASEFASAHGSPMGGYVTASVALMEFGILVALFYGRFALSRARDAERTPLSALLTETLRGRGIVLMGGGLLIGAVVGERNFARIEPFFVDLFRGILVLFLLEMGMLAARNLRAFLAVGPRMAVYGVAMPIVHGTLAAALATAAGLPLGSAFVLACCAGSASYIDAPAAVRVTFPQASPSIYLTSSLGVTFPFMLILGVPILWQITVFLQGALP